MPSALGKYITHVQAFKNKFFKVKKEILSYTFEEHQCKRKYWLFLEYFTTFVRTGKAVNVPLVYV